MSDKNRNTNDINDQKTAEQQAFSEEIRRRLAEPGSGKPTLDEFKVMVYKDREKRRKKRNALVACVVAAFVVGLFSFEYFVPEVGADKNPKEIIQTEDGVIIEDGGWGSSTGEDNQLVIEDWKYISSVKEIYPQLPLVEYVPRGYSFYRLNMEIIDDDTVTCEYIFKGKDDLELEIEVYLSENNNKTTFIEDISTEIHTDLGKIYIQESNEEKKATIQKDDGTIVSIWSLLDNEELIRLLENIKF